MNRRHWAGRVTERPAALLTRKAEVKTYNHLFEQVYQFDNLYAAYERARKGKRDRAEVLRFEQNLEGELIQLQNELIWDHYETGAYRTFHVFEPKARLVAAQPFRDRVLQHSLVGVIEPIWERRFHYHSYACRPGRGMHIGADTAQRWLREVQATHGRAYCLKADVAKYFPSIDHEILMRLIERRITCKRTLGLCHDIMESWYSGLPIGNLTSQLWANVYLHELDTFVKQHLGVKRYIRYMDDFLIVHHDKALLHAFRRVIEAWLWDHLRLRLNNKTQVFPVGQRNGRALDFLGYRMWPTHRRLRRDSVKRMEKKLQRLQKQYAEGAIGFTAIRQRINSWLGHASRADSYRIRRKLLGNAVFTRNHTARRASQCDPANCSG